MQMYENKNRTKSCIFSMLLPEVMMAAVFGSNREMELAENWKNEAGTIQMQMRRWSSVPVGKERSLVHKSAA
jgi:hypothetical protein